MTTERSWPGELVAGRYRVGQALGGGGFGAVYAATDERSLAWSDVVLKWLRPVPAKLDAATFERFRDREIAAMRGVVHPNMVRMLDAVVHEGHCFLVLERLRGRTLAERLEQEGAAGWEAALRLMLPVAHVLAELRDGQGTIVHRDVKPANIFLARQPGGRVVTKLLDFGISRVGADRDPTAPVGTLSYIPPEGFRENHPTEAYDVWQLGVVLYELITGQRPFERDTVEATVQAILSDEPRPLQHVPEGFDAFVREELLAKAAPRRPSREAVAQRLEQFLPGARPRHAQARSAPRQRIGPIVATGMISLGVGLGLGAFTVEHGDLPGEDVPLVAAPRPEPISEEPAEPALPASITPAPLPEPEHASTPKPVPTPARLAGPVRLPFRLADAEGRGTGGHVAFWLEQAGMEGKRLQTPQTTWVTDPDKLRMRFEDGAWHDVVLRELPADGLCLVPPAGDGTAGHVMPCLPAQR